MRNVLTLLALTACGSVIQATPINPAPRAMRSREPSTVLVFTSGPPTHRSYVDVTLLEARQGYSADDTPQFLEQLRARAAAMGCDGLVVGGPTNTTTIGLDLHTMHQRGLVATCIVFNDDAPALANQ